MSKRKRLSTRVLGLCMSAHWLLALTALNLAFGGMARGTLLFALPVVVTAWFDWTTGLIFAAIAIVCAWIGGAMPDPHSVEPLWVVALWAFARLSVLAFVSNAWGRRARRRADAQRDDRGLHN